MFEALEDKERDSVRRAVLAAAEGPFFPGWEFQTLLGRARSELRNTADVLLATPVSNEVPFELVNNALFFMITYPHKKPEQLLNYQIDIPELIRIHRKLRESLGKATDKFLDFVE